jgi:hypothetical protein
MIKNNGKVKWLPCRALLPYLEACSTTDQHLWSYQIQLLPIHHGKRVTTPIQNINSSQKLTASSWSVFVGLAVIIIFSAVAWFAAPKGETQTYVHLTLGCMSCSVLPFPGWSF